MSRKHGRDIAASDSHLPQLQPEEDDADAFTLLGRTVTDLPLPVLHTVLPPRPPASLQKPSRGLCSSTQQHVH